MRLLFLLVAVLGQTCSAQVWMPEGTPQSNRPYAYIRAEIKALHWIRNALAESEKFQPLAPNNDRERFHNNVRMYTVAETVSDDYNCAVSMLTPYKDSKNEYISESVDSFLKAIGATKDVNGKLIGIMEAINKATKPEDIDQVLIAKVLANIKMIQKDVATLLMAGAKMSTFGILSIEGDGDNVKPAAFTITAAERATLLAEARVLANARRGQRTYVDGCAEILVGTLSKQLRVSAP